MYTEKVMDHFMNPRNVGEIENADGVGEVGNAKCGDIMKIFIKVEDERIVDVKFKTFGCGAAIATSSMATEMIIGKTIQEALEVTNKAVMEALGGLPPVKVHCSLLAEQAVHAALWDYAQKNGIEIEGLKKPTSWKKPTRTKLNLKIKKTDCFRCGKQSVLLCRYSAGLASSGVAGMGVKLGSGVGCGACVCSGVGSGVSSGIGVSRGSTVSTDDVISGRGVITVL